MKPRSPSAAPATVDNRVVATSSLRTAEADPNHPDYLRGHLERYGLIPLAETRLPVATEHYRFLWERWMHPTVLIEVEFTEDGAGTYRALVWNDGLGKDSWTTEKTRNLTKKDLEAFRLMVDRYGLLSVPKSEGAPGFEGSSWYIEVVSRNRQNEIYRWSPEFGHVRAFGVYLINMGIDSPLVPIF